MWEQYRKTFIPMQATIIGLCAVFYFIAGVPVAGLASVFITMEIGAIYGARWAMRLKGRTAGSDKLPLHNRP